MKKNDEGSKKRWITKSILFGAIIVLLVAGIGCAKPKDSKIDTEPTEAVATESLPTTTPQIECDGVRVIYDVYNYPEYTNYFDSVRDDENIYILGIFITDIDNDGTCELYANSFETGTHYSSKIIECYDLKTDTYSKIISPEGMEYYTKVYEDSLYFTTHYDEDVIDEFRIDVYEPYLNDGELHLEEADSELAGEIIKQMWRTFIEKQYGSNARYVIDIAIYDVTQGEVFIRNYSQDTRGLTDELLLFFIPMESGTNEEVSHQYKAVVNLEYGDNQQPMTLLFGDSKYLIGVFDDIEVNFTNDELREFLLSLADGSYDGN